MQWSFIITAEQWSAFGTFWGGMAQVGLVVVGVLAGREWLRQKRFDGVRLLLEEYVLLHHEMQKSLAQLSQRTSTGTTSTFEESRDTAMNVLDVQRIQLLSIVSRSQMYDDDLSDGFNAVNEQLKTYRQNYIQYRFLPIGESARELSPEDAQHNDNERRRLAMMLFVPDSDWWVEFARLNGRVMQQGRRLLWQK
jgi:hypothetical protein